MLPFAFGAPQRPRRNGLHRAAMRPGGATCNTTYINTNGRSGPFCKVAGSSRHDVAQKRDTRKTRIGRRRRAARADHLFFPDAHLAPERRIITSNMMF
jgi:hypothetical protein